MFDTARIDHTGDVHVFAIREKGCAVRDVVWAEFHSPAGRLVRRPVSQLLREALEEREPVWKPVQYRGKQAIATWWRPAGAARHAGCATLEALAAARALEFDPEVAAFTAWPVRLSWADGGGAHVPDFFARLADGRARLVVRAPGGTAGEDWPGVLRLLDAAGRQAGWQVRVHTPADTSVAEAENRRRLSRYRHARLADAEAARLLHVAFATPRPLTEGVAATGLPELSALAQAHHLIWKRDLRIDWNLPFVPARSLVWSPAASRAVA
ncbi:TnsA-like heteromeric transposase endonuclease subunit [Streptomyces europaeiscabiei]|uniref:TnsA-like heteromeric transposase endonuclease subunit n=1 Tax=Streptomyces europaeiscabiei TaxID=146819 RepID=UPI000E69FD45|nr:TnsA-like heteromeric transposase endonuclease subunit [Streptomyces europaeiscabiei]